MDGNQANVSGGEGVRIATDRILRESRGGMRGDVFFRGRHDGYPGSTAEPDNRDQVQQGLSMLPSVPRIGSRLGIPMRARTRRRLRPVGEPLEGRFLLDGATTTYIWTALGDGSSFNDPNNWTHVGPFGGGVGVTGVPSIGSNLQFPSFAQLPVGSSTTINFNGTYGSLAFGAINIGDSYTFQGNGIAVDGGILVSNPQYRPPTTSTINLSSLNLGRQAAIYTPTGSSLTIGSTATPTGLQLTLQGGVVKLGDGQLNLDTQVVSDPRTLTALQTFVVGGGTVALGTSANYSNSLFQVGPGASLDVADGASVQVGSLSGPGTVDLQGTSAAGDATALTAFTPVGESETLSGSLIGAGTLTMQGNGTLSLGKIGLGPTSAVDVVLGTLDVNGTISAGSLQVESGTFGGLGNWLFSGPVTFQGGSTFQVALDGLSPGIQSTQLVSGSATGIDLGNSTLTGSVNYEYQAGDTFTIATSPSLQGTFQNVVGGMVLLGNNVPFAVNYLGNSVVLTALQSETTTRLFTSGSPSHPGQAVTFTAVVSTRTQPVGVGTVLFEQGNTVLASVPISGGSASFTTTGLPLGDTSVTAVYVGSGNILGSISAQVVQSVVPFSTVTVLSASPNPSSFRQPVTLTATVTADGAPVASGRVTFVVGHAVLGVVSLGPDGVARLTTTALPRRLARIQALFGGTVDDYGSVSAPYAQEVARAATSMTLTATTRFNARGRPHAILTASVEAVGPTGVEPVGEVVFRRDGVVIGRRRLVGGLASIGLPVGRQGRGRFVANFLGNARYGGGSSMLVLQARTLRLIRSYRNSLEA